MIKLTQTIVDQSYRLIGFTGEGKAKDFGDLSNEKVMKPISLKFIFGTRFSNKQISVKNGTIIEHEGFRLNKLPMIMLTDSGYVNVDNTIKLTKRYVQDNVNIGFGVEMGGTPAKFTYENVLKLCDLFNPVNFVIRTGKDNKRYISGKPGSSISDLPVEVVGTTTAAKRVKPTTKEAGPVTGELVHEVDILQLYEFIRSVNGYIINLPGTEYKATTESAAAAKEFVPFGIGEVGVPYLDFNESKFNVNCNFKKPGAVAIELKPGRITNVITYVYRRKNVFFNGENYIKKLGVVVPTSSEAELLSRFGKSMAMTAITDPGMVSPICMLIGQTNVKIYEVDTSKIGIIAKSRIDSFILDTNNLYKDVLQLTGNKFIIKYLNGLIKDLKATGCVPESSKLRDIAPQFAAMDNSELEKLSENGIDIYTGAYTSKDESRKTSGSSEDTVEVEYAIEGLNANSLTYKKMVEDGSKNPDFLNSVISSMESIENFGDRADKAYEMLEKLQKTNDEIKRRIWLHKCAMYLKSNKSSVHSHDAKMWVLNDKKRTKAKCYNSKVKGCERLQLLVLNIDIK